MNDRCGVGGARRERSEGVATRYVRDDRGNVTRIEFPDGGTVERTFNALGLVSSETDPNRTVTSFHYNGLSQLSALSFQTAAGVAPTSPITFEYDELGRKRKVSQASVSIRRSFDAFNRVIKEQQDGGTVQWEFDDLANTVLLRFPDSREDLYTRDAIGRLKSVTFNKRGSANLLPTLSPGAALAAYGYDGFLATSRRLVNGATTRWSYDYAFRRTQIETVTGAGALDQEQYFYDGEGRIRLSVRSALATSNKAFSYDELSRVLSALSGQLVTGTVPALADQAATDAFLANGVNAATATRSEMLA